jgi:hypothetical protein
MNNYILVAKFFHSWKCFILRKVLLCFDSPHLLLLHRSFWNWPNHQTQIPQQKGRECTPSLRTSEGSLPNFSFAMKFIPMLSVCLRICTWWSGANAKPGLRAGIYGQGSATQFQNLCPFPLGPHKQQRNVRSWVFGGQSSQFYSIYICYYSGSWKFWGEK